MLVLALLVAGSWTFVARAGGATTNDCSLDLPRDKYLKTHGNKCYYFFMNDWRDFRDAREECYDTGGRLALVKTKDINEFLHITMQYEFSRDVSDSHKNVWIGLTDLDREGEFRWLDGSHMVYNNFETLQGPDGYFWDRLSEDCVTMNPKSGKWYDFECSSFLSIYYRPFICEYDAKAPPVTHHRKNPSMTTTSVQKQTSTTPSTRKIGTATTTATRPSTRKIGTATTTATRPSTRKIGTATTTATGPSTRKIGTATTTTTTLTKKNNISPPVLPTQTTHIVASTSTTSLSKTPTAPKPTCPNIICTLNCGMEGYQTDVATGCMICACNPPV